MICDKCGERGFVYLCKHKENGSVYRRRRCRSCGNTWTTIELDVRYMKGIISDMTRVVNDLKKR